MKKKQMNRHSKLSCRLKRCMLGVAWSVVCCLGVSSVAAEPATATELLKGVTRITSPGVPGDVCVFGDEAFPVVADAASHVVVGATTFGKGRVVLWGHNGYFGKQSLESADTGRLLLNAVHWVAQSRQQPRVGFVGRGDGINYLKSKGVSCRRIKLDQFATVDLIVGSVDQASETVRNQLTDWIRTGGGVISSGTGWGWSQLNPGKDLSVDYAANRLFAPMGLVFAGNTCSDTTKDGFEVAGPPDASLNASLALDTVLQHTDHKATLTKQQLANAGRVLSMALRAIPADDTVLRPKIDAALKKRRIDPVPTKKQPIDSSHVLARLVLSEQIRRLQTLKATEVTAHRSAAVFPGVLPKGTRKVTRTVTIPTAVSGWHSTGLYADAGDLITVEVPASTIDGRLKVRLGSTTCQLWNKDRWTRCPVITREFDLKTAQTQVASAFGGLVYIVVPKGCSLGDVSVTIRGAAEAPYFVLGKTTQRQWRSRGRLLPAPWAELASDKVILTVPSQVIRQLDDPDSLLRTWSDILDAAADLAQRPRERERPQRYVADIQLCAGYMHAGNPIMVPTSTAAKLVDRHHLLHEGDWGFFHELGHMHQNKDWTFSGTGEVTVNLFTMFVFDKVCGIPPEKGRMAQPGIRKQYADYFRSGTPFDQWKSKPFLALYMYYQLQQAFGWKAFQKVFAEYRDLPAVQRPKSDTEKRDQWMIRFSHAVNRNLGPFFQAWGIPTTPSARTAIQDLPSWLPTDLPPTE